MKFHYQFANLLGAVYHRGDLVFDPSSNSLYSPVGNKLVTYDIKNGRSRALVSQVEYNIKHVALSPNGRLLIVSTERSQVHILSPQTGRILYRKDFEKKLSSINGIKFSPDGKYYVLLADNKALIYLTPGIAFTGSGRELSPFKIHKVIKAHYDEITCVSWSPDSNLIALGSKDLTVKIFGAHKQHPRIPNLINLAGHSDIIADEDDDETPKRLSFSRSSKHFFNDSLKTDSSRVYVSNVEYSNKIHLLVTGFTNGAILIHDMPDFSLIYSLELGNLGSIDSIVMSPDTDWIAFGSGVRPLTHGDIDGERLTQSQLIVWEWRTENFVFKQSGTGAGFTHVTDCVAYSADALVLASGGTDCKIRIWDTISGFCFVTFSEEHKGPITALEFQPNSPGKVLVSASLDGTVRAFDLTRYRNFRTLTGPSESKPAQFISLAVDLIGGDFIAAGSQNFPEIFLWSLKAGRLLECLAGHEGPVSGLKFSPVNNILISCSWDRTVRTWNLFEGRKCTREVLQLGSDALSLSIRPEGNQIAVSSVNGNIYFFDPESGEMIGAPIEGQKDLGFTKTVKDEAQDRDKFFTSLAYSSDGQYLICGGQSKSICIYHAEEKVLVKRFTLTRNQSLEGIFDYISKRKRAEFGFNEALIRAREDGDYAPISLPGVKQGDVGERDANPIIATYCVQFSPTMRSFVAATTEGLLIYSLDTFDYFDPYELSEDVTPSSVKACIENGEYLDALMQSLKLKDTQLFAMSIERTPLSDIPLVVKNLPLKYVELSLSFLSSALETTKHLEFYIIWCQTILRQDGLALKTNYSNASSVNADLRLLHRNISRWSESLQNLVDFNKYRLTFFDRLGNSELIDDQEVPSSDIEMFDNDSH
ncbi:periodic tryptophan protein 2 homolog isoform X2 [Brevipalpus obovatus]|uniref:periodic tryptophan protein 2 homolog isoform X2 n=1 Tax=Brevipalpus obovatus TaxID=246614 RepID=UPI003D9F5EBD